MKPDSPCSFSNTCRADGLPLEATVAKVMARGSINSAPIASSIHRANSSNGLSSGSSKMSSGKFAVFPTDER